LTAGRYNDRITVSKARTTKGVGFKESQMAKSSEVKFRNVRSPAKNAKAHARRVARQAERREAAEKRNAAWSALYREQKITSLLSRPGYAEKQLKKLGFLIE
jgi:hypothetical protein